MIDLIEIDSEFEALEKLGFTTDYASIKNGKVSPCVTAEEAKKGWFQKGTKVHWKDQNGWDYERNEARKILDENTVYTVEICRIGQSQSSYKLEGFDNEFNSVMFKLAE